MAQAEAVMFNEQQAHNSRMYNQQSNQPGAHQAHWQNMYGQTHQTQSQPPQWISNQASFSTHHSSSQLQPHMAYQHMQNLSHTQQFQLPSRPSSVMTGPNGAPAIVAYISPPPPGWDIANDPEAFRRYFMTCLSDLTSSQKHLINGLTILAQEHVRRMSEIVGECLDQHLRSVS